MVAYKLETRYNGEGKLELLARLNLEPNMSQADIVVLNRLGEIELLVEVKPRLGMNREWAAQTRHNLSSHGLLGAAPYFLMTLPDRFYLWKDAPENMMVLSDFDIDPRSFLAPYWGNAGVSDPELSGGGFELVVRAWLTSLLWSRDISEAVSENGIWVAESGLWEAINQGQIAHLATV